MEQQQDTIILHKRPAAEREPRANCDPEDGSLNTLFYNYQTPPSSPRMTHRYKEKNQTQLTKRTMFHDIVNSTYA